MHAVVLLTIYWKRIGQCEPWGQNAIVFHNVARTSEVAVE